MKYIIKISVYAFAFIGLLLLVAFVVKVWQDGKISPLGVIDFPYAKMLSESAQVLSITWSIIGVLLIILTLNVQKDQFSDNQKFIQKQQFETTFFNMLNVLHNIKLAMKKKVEDENFEGQNFIDYALARFAEEYRGTFSQLLQDAPLKMIFQQIEQNQVIEPLERDVIRDDLNNLYVSFYKNFHSELGHYFRYLYNLIQFTVKNRKAYKDDPYYMNLIQAQLSNGELGLIFYNVLSEKGLNRLKVSHFFNILEEYNFFENIDENALIMRSHHVVYPATKFKFLNRDELGVYHL